MLQILLIHDPIAIMVDQRERLSELLDLRRGEEREDARGLAALARRSLLGFGVMLVGR